MKTIEQRYQEEIQRLARRIEAKARREAAEAGTPEDANEYADDIVDDIEKPLLLGGQVLTRTLAGILREMTAERTPEDRPELEEMHWDDCVLYAMEDIRDAFTF